MKFITIIVTIMVMVVVAARVTVQSSLETFKVNGTITVRNEFFAYLEIFKQSDFGGPTMYFGGGTVISTSFILTCAQNVVGFKSWRVGLGAHIISEMQWFLSTISFVHHGYNNETLADNVALLRLTQFTTMSTGIVPIALPLATSTEPVYAANIYLYGFGFGTTDNQPSVMQLGTFTVVTQKICEDRYPHLAQTGQIAKHVCAERTEGSICAGDQGGPAISVTSSVSLVGIQSFYRYENCDSLEAQPAAIIRVPKYVAWINNVTSTQPL